MIGTSSSLSGGSSERGSSSRVPHKARISSVVRSVRLRKVR